MALDLDGVDDRVTHGDIAGIDLAANFTIMFWLYVDTLVTSDRIVSKRVEPDSTICFLLIAAAGNNSILEAWIAASTTKGETATGTLVAGQWDHYAMVYAGGGAANADRLKIYKNGADLSLTFTGTIPTTLGDAGTDVLTIGATSSGASAYDGKFSHVKAWTAALTAAEIRQEKNAALPVRRINLQLWAPYTDGGRARDYSGNGNHGTITGALVAATNPPILTERRIRIRKRRATVGLWGHRVLP